MASEPVANVINYRKVLVVNIFQLNNSSCVLSDAYLIQEHSGIDLCAFGID